MARFLDTWKIEYNSMLLHSRLEVGVYLHDNNHSQFMLHAFDEKGAEVALIFSPDQARMLAKQLE